MDCSICRKERAKNKAILQIGVGMISEDNPCCIFPVDMEVCDGCTVLIQVAIREIRERIQTARVWKE